MERKDREGKKIKWGFLNKLKMGGPCMDGGGTLDGCLLESEFSNTRRERDEEESRKCREAAYSLINLVDLGDDTLLIYERSYKLNMARVTRVRGAGGFELREQNVRNINPAYTDKEIISELNHLLIG